MGSSQSTTWPMTSNSSIALAGAATGTAFYVGGIAALLAGVSTGGLLLLGIIPAGLTCFIADARR